MAEKPSWIRWLLLGLAVFGVMCVGSGLMVWKFGGTVSRYAISSPIPAGKAIVTDGWTLTPPSAEWRRLKPAAERGMPVKKDAWLIHTGTGALLTVEGVESGGNNQHIPARLADAMLEQHKTDGTGFELLASEEFETCGAPAQLREYRATREGTPMGYVEATYASRGHGYVVTAWGEAEHARALRDELLRGAKGFCPVDTDYDREWLRNFFIISDQEPFKSAFSEEAGSPEERGQRALDFQVAGVARLSRRELARFTELMLVLTKDASPDVCAGVFRWETTHIDAQLHKRKANEVRDWFRIARHAQQAVLDETWADDAAEPEAQDFAYEAATQQPELREAIDGFERGLEAAPETYCTSARALFTHALSLEGDDREAMLRVLVTYD